MNKIITTDIVDPNIQQPFTGRSLDFLQNIITQMVAALSGSVMGNTNAGLSATQGVAIQGATTNLAGTTIFAGYIYFAGELYSFPGYAGYNTFVNPPQFILNETNDPTADPVEFSDGINRSVHKVRALELVDQATPGLFLLSNLINIYPLYQNQSIINSWTNFVTVRALKRVDGTIRLSGQVTGGLGVPTSSIMFNLPAGYRPIVQLYIPTVINDAGTNYITGLISIATNGDVAILNDPSYTITGTMSVYLDGVTFRID